MASGPITWRNVQGPNPRDAMLPMAVASQTINNAFSNLKDTFSEHQAGVKDRNTNAALNALYSQFTTPEALNDAINSGAAQRLLASFGPMVDQDKLREAPGARLTESLQRSQAWRDHSLATTKEAQRDILERAKALAYTDPAAAQRLLAENPHLIGQGDVAKSIFDTNTTLSNQERLAAADARAAAESSQRLAQGHLNLIESQRSAENTERMLNTDAWIAPQLAQLGEAVARGYSTEDASNAVQGIKAAARERGFKDSDIEAVIEANKHLLTSPLRKYGVAELDQKLSHHLDETSALRRFNENPFANSPSSFTDMIKGVESTLEERSLKPEGWFWKAEKAKLENAVGRNMHRQFTYEDAQGNKRRKPIPLALHQMAILAAYDSFGPGDIDEKYEENLERLMKDPGVLWQLSDMEAARSLLDAYDGRRILTEGIMGNGQKK